jgi:hypothetical protein
MDEARELRAWHQSDKSIKQNVPLPYFSFQVVQPVRENRGQPIRGQGDQYRDALHVRSAAGTRGGYSLAVVPPEELEAKKIEPRRTWLIASRIE